MKFELQIVSEGDSGRRRGRLAGNPLTILPLVVVLFWLALFVRQTVKFTWDHYSPYEGTVVEIKRHWTDRLTSESGDVEYLLIRTPEGRLIDKCISFERRIVTHIRKGDYVTKKRGFTHRIQRLTTDRETRGA